MPRKSPSVPRYSLHKPSGRAYVRIGEKFIYLGVYDSPKSLEAYGRIVAEVSTNPTPISPQKAIEGITILEVCAAYLDFWAWFKPG
jgi:hypothetical protein